MATAYEVIVNHSLVGRTGTVCDLKRMQGAMRLASFPHNFHSHRLRAPAVRPLRMPKGLVCRAMDASFGGSESAQVFPRLNVRDPFKRLGVSSDASTEEIREAKNYLSEQYHNHERSRESIEAAYEKIMMESYRSRKASKINLKSNLKKKVEESPPWVRAILNMVEVPNKTIIGQRAALFLLLGVWSVFNPAEGGPAFQVAVSLAACVYFINDRLKSLGRAFVLGLSSLVVGWVFGSVLIPVLPPQLLPRAWGLELPTALISYVFLWFSCTFMK
ncbi:hypothetical protein KC19_10G139800 [Ceratodon purpureus]|uniref:Protein CHAPERONE-LIKE PROTEIN OF POR1, chloroplastic n=1 Tax=Ceratodon purpureus TaxID=3225 RepID=A0A8T0GN51_CERPU|nr:hypothetical protein KC19_10G139800 [Ceratodon purpureus]